MSPAAVRTAPPPARGDRLELGDRVRLRGHVWRVVSWQGESISLAPADRNDTELTALFAALVGAEDFAVLDRADRPLTRTELSSRTGQFDALPVEVRADALRWQRHVMEVLHQQAPNVPATGVPHPAYDPATHTLQERYRAKAAQLSALGWDVSHHTVERKCRAWRRSGPMGLVDRRRTRPPSPCGRTDPRVVDVLWQVLDAEAGKSAGTVTRLWELVRARVARRYRAEMRDPKERRRLTVPRATFYRLLHRLGVTVEDVAGSTARRSADRERPPPPYTPTAARVPGELMQIDTTGLDVLAIGDDGRPTQVEATVLIDVATRTIAGEMIVPKRSGHGPHGNRVGGRATRSQDAVFALAQALAPVPARAGWSPLTLMEGSDLPYEELLAADPRMAGAAARPVIRPRTVVIDHGKAYTGSAFSSACAELGIEVRHARTRTPTDKAIVERAMRTIKTRFGQWLAGHTAHRLELRGKNVERQPLWRIDQIQDMFSQWIALEWQQTPHGGLRSPYTPGKLLTPNQMYAAQIARCGYRALPLTQDQNRKLLPAVWVTVDRKGFRIDNRTYNRGTELAPFRGKSGIPGRRGRWEVHYNPYRPEVAWLFDHRAREGEDPWVEVPFVHRRLLDDPWTEDLWAQARAAHVAAGGDRRDEAAICRAVGELRERARRGRPAAERRVPAPLFRGPDVDVDTPPHDPYAGIPDVDPNTITPYRSLDVPAADLFPDPVPPTEPLPGELPDHIGFLNWDIAELDPPGPNPKPPESAGDDEAGGP